MEKKHIILIVISILLLAGGYFLSTLDKKKPATVLLDKEALNMVFAKYPDLVKYKTTDLPPSSIESKQGQGGWYFGFIRRGSGVPGILDAKCYFSDNKNVTLVGEFKKDTTNIVESINLETCEPSIQNPIVAPVVPDIKVIKKDAPIVIPAGKCFVGGCSSQICSDREGMASTCEYREEYACYKTATCKRQTNGNCGWTETSELKACLLKN